MTKPVTITLTLDAESKKLLEEAINKTTSASAQEVNELMDVIQEKMYPGRSQMSLSRGESLALLFKAVAVARKLTETVETELCGSIVSAGINQHFAENFPEGPA